MSVVKLKVMSKLFFLPTEEINSVWKANGACFVKPKKWANIVESSLGPTVLNYLAELFIRFSRVTLHHETSKEVFVLSRGRFPCHFHHLCFGSFWNLLCWNLLSQSSEVKTIDRWPLNPVQSRHFGSFSVIVNDAQQVSGLQFFVVGGQELLNIIGVVGPDDHEMVEVVGVLEEVFEVPFEVESFVDFVGDWQVVLSELMHWIIMRWIIRQMHLRISKSLFYTCQQGHLAKTP